MYDRGFIKYICTTLLFVCLQIVCFVPMQAQRYNTTSGTVNFVSNAPLERIAATSRTIKGVVDPLAGTFAFTIDIESFQGFNSPLQRVHFNENYMETGDFPIATFAGKFIEDVDLMQDGTHEVRVKGNLIIHGIEKERIIKGTVQVNGNELKITSTFTVLLEDHEIRIPKVVLQKIAKVVDVDVSLALSLR
jgi:hypothetical protein